MAKKSMKPVAAAIGAAFAGTMLGATAGAAENPFALSELSSGYMQVAAADGKCGTGKCGAKPSNTSAAENEVPKAEEHKCGGAKPAEGKCGAKPAEGKCGGMPTEGKCGTGKCGGKK